MPNWTPGQNLDNGRFTIEKYLGGGGFGVTYRAKDQQTGKLVVIKTLNEKRQAEADFQQRQAEFMSEALRLAMHSNYNGAPLDGSAWIDNDNNYLVLRGGSWINIPVVCRSASRFNVVRAERDDLGNDFGFRVVCAVGRTY